MTIDDALAREAARVRRSLESLLEDGAPDPRAREDLHRVLGTLASIQDGSTTPGAHRDPGQDGGGSRVVTFRLRDDRERETLRERAQQAGTTVSEYIRSRVLDEGDAGGAGNVENAVGNGRGKKGAGEPPVAGIDETMGAQTRQLVGDITFLFTFFQQNKSKLDVSDEEYARLKEILERIKGLNHGT